MEIKGLWCEKSKVFAGNLVEMMEKKGLSIVHTKICTWFINRGLFRRERTVLS